MKTKINQARNWERMCQTIYQKVDLYMEARNARRRCRKQLENVNGGYNGSRGEYQTRVLSFWSKYGIKPQKMWYDLYCYKEASYEPHYIPEDLYWRRVYPALNRTFFRQAYTDKCFYKQLFPYLKQPRTILKASNNSYIDENGNYLSYSKAKATLEAENCFVIKPAIYSGEGIDIFFYDKDKHKDIDLDELMKSYGSNYIVQEIATQHKTLSEIHPHSLNTVRVISFLFRGEVHISSAILRMGVGGSRLDNVSSGGIACPIQSDGRLKEKAINRESKWVTRHPGGRAFSDIKVPSFEKILEAVRRAHKDVPHFRIIGWDFSVDKEGEPVLIEYNGGPGMNQVSCGPLFGDHTEAVLDMILLNKPEFSE